MPWSLVGSSRPLPAPLGWSRDPVQDFRQCRQHIRPRARASGWHHNTHRPTPRAALIDSPGFQEFGLNHIEPMKLALCMPDFKALAGDCRFYNCTHRQEPGCAVTSQVKTDLSPGGISVSRYKIYSELFAELSQTRY